MKPSTLLMIGVLASTGIAQSAYSATADGTVRPGNATVSFGQWIADPGAPLDRLNANPAAGAGNNHELLPNTVKIEVGGAVNFAISGLHNVQVYDDGTQPADISTASPLPGAAGGIIDSTNQRIYRGWDPNLIPNDNQRDRVEVVQFTEPGTYLVICGVVNHFVDDQMFGFVEVTGERNEQIMLK
jgi:plastocyanin